MQRYAFQNWIYHFISDTNRDRTVLDDVIIFIDTSLEEFGNWMLRAGCSDAVERINTDLTASLIQLQQIQHPMVQSKLLTLVRRVKVRRSGIEFHGRLTFTFIYSLAGKL
jgi:hypothetical protein